MNLKFYDKDHSSLYFGRDPEILITASDDYTLKIWRSRHRARQLNLPLVDLPVGMEFRQRSSLLN